MLNGDAKASVPPPFSLVWPPFVSKDARQRFAPIAPRPGPLPPASSLALSLRLSLDVLFPRSPCSPPARPSQRPPATRLAAVACASCGAASE
ncbi:hypothetical protein OF83DRAFT_1180522 [Amylostereum chailletii]|nr:hypothetical protein OF83DRAFT_1180522 [Amylostereum chailletii]